MKISKNIDIINTFVFLNIFFSIGYYTLQGSYLYNNLLKGMLAFSIFSGIMAFALTLFVCLKQSAFKIFIFSALLFTIFMRFFLAIDDTRTLFFALEIIVSFSSTVHRLVGYAFWTKFIFVLPVLATGGYHHINGLALHIGVLLLLYVSKTNFKLKVKQIILLFLLYVIFFVITDSGSFKICIGLLLLLILFSRIRFGEKILNSKLWIYIFPVMMFFNVYAALNLERKKILIIGNALSVKTNEQIHALIQLLDKYTTGRITLGCYSLKVFGVSALGGNVNYSKLSLQDDQYFNLDSGYLWLLQEWGWIATIVVMVLFCVLMWYLIKERKTNIIICAIALSCWAINEDMFLSIGTNFLILLIGPAIRKIISKRWKMKNGYSKSNPLLLVRGKTIAR